MAVVWQNGVAYDTNCPQGCKPPNCRKPVRYTSGGLPVWSMTSRSGWAARPITNPDQVPCGMKQVDVKQHNVISNLAKAAAIGVGAVALTSLGSGVLAKSAGTLSKAAGSAAGTGGAAAATGASAAKIAEIAAQTGGLFGQIKEHGNRILQFVNQGRAIHAIANGEIPPPPISITGDSFTEWALAVAKDQILKEHQRKMTKAEEDLLRLEIERMQRDLAMQVPENFPKSPSTQIPASVQQASADMAAKAKSDYDMLLKIGAVALPLLLVIATRG